MGIIHNVLYMVCGRRYIPGGWVSSVGVVEGWGACSTMSSLCVSVVGMYCTPSLCESSLGSVAGGEGSVADITDLPPPPSPPHLPTPPPPPPPPVVSQGRPPLLLALSHANKGGISL